MKKIYSHLTRSFKEAERFDAKFWEKAGASAKFSALWKMVEEYYKIKNRHGYKLRLQRSVQNIEQA